MISHKSQTHPQATAFFSPPSSALSSDPMTQRPGAMDIQDLVIEYPLNEIDAHAEDSYWAEHFRESPHVSADTPYPHVRAAYRFGWESRRRLPDVAWTVALPRLRSEWSADPANFVMSWNEAEHAVREAWLHAGTDRSH